MREKVVFCFFLIGLLSLLDQVILTSKIPETELRYSWLTTQRQSAVGFNGPSCSASAHRLTLASTIRLRTNPMHAVNLENWAQGKGMLKLPTWGCGLAYYDNGGGKGRVKTMYKWGEGRSEGPWLGQKSTLCGDMTFILVEEARLLCVSGADIDKYLNR